MDSLASVVSALKTYSEQIVRNVAKSNSEEIISNVEKELQAKQRESLLRSVYGLTHLIEGHKGKPEKVFKAFLDADSYDDLFKRLDDAMGREACEGAKQEMLYSQDQVNSVRQALGLKPFARHESGDFDRMRLRRLHKLREAEKDDSAKRSDKQDS